MRIRRPWTELKARLQILNYSLSKFCHGSLTPLTTLELQHALAVEAGESEFDEENLPEVEDMISVCAGLVTVDEQSAIIRLVHYTTQEYFERTQYSWFPDAERDIATACVSYLLFDSFGTGFCQTDEEFETRLQLNPLYDYATRNWGHHVPADSTKLKQLMLNFFKSETKMSSSGQAMLAAKHRYSAFSQRMPRRMTGAHFAAYFGLGDVMIAILENRGRADSNDSHDRTPLSYAAANGHERVVRLLADRADVEADMKDQSGRTPLSQAAEHGHEAVVRLLMDRTDVEADSKDRFGRTSLWWAAATKREPWMVRSDYEAVLGLLLANNLVDVNARDGSGRTCLSLAAGEGHRARVKLLLAKPGIILDSEDNLGQTPLDWATVNGQQDAIALLQFDKN